MLLRRSGRGARAALAEVVLVAPTRDAATSAATAVAAAAVRPVLVNLIWPVSAPSPSPLSVTGETGARWRRRNPRPILVHTAPATCRRGSPRWPAGPWRHPVGRLGGRGSGRCAGRAPARKPSPAGSTPV